MEEMEFSRFRATCLAVLERVGKTGRPIRVTRFGKPIAEVVPLSVPTRSVNWLGAMSGTGQIIGDIVSASADPKDWNMLAD
jgi:antitoxin (DNA-binding transcriptional repressor) of toxin-antitoxin stability system